jgi:hypothetical protein
VPGGATSAESEASAAEACAAELLTLERNESSVRELDKPEEIFKQEKTIYQVILSRLAKSQLLKAEQKETLAYRLAEIFVASRILYTQVLPVFVDGEQDGDPERAAVRRTDAQAGLSLSDATPEASDSSDEAILETLGEVRMNLLNLKDLVEDFEDVFLESLAERQGADEEGDDAEETSAPPLGRG